jgi:hypothetical protein
MLRLIGANGRSHERAATTGASAGGAPEAMFAGEDFAVLNCRGIDVPQRKATTMVAPLHFEHLVKVAIENLAAPIPL